MQYFLGRKEVAKKTRLSPETIDLYARKALRDGFGENELAFPKPDVLIGKKGRGWKETTIDKYIEKRQKRGLDDQRK